MSGVLGKYRIAVDTAAIADGDSIASYLVDSAGALLTSTLVGAKQSLDVLDAADKAEDAAHTSGDMGQFMLAVRNDTEGSMVSADGDYAPLQVDSLGRLRVLADISINNDFVYAEDSAHVSGDLGSSVLLVRQDTLASSTSADGDYGQFKSTNLGELYVKDSSANTTLSSLLSELQSVTFAEDSGHVSGDAGIFALAVRNDANATLTSADLDYSPLAVDSAGRLKVVSATTANAEKAEDSASASADIGNFVLAVRNDATASLVGTSGDYAAFQLDALGRLKVLERMDTASLQQVISVSTTALALPAASLANRQHLIIQNQGGGAIFIGSATVTSSGATKGIEVPKGGFWEGDVGPNNIIYAIAASGSNNVAVMELS